MKPRYKATIRQVIAGAYNGKQFEAASSSTGDNIASNEAWRQLAAIAFGGYQGVLEIEISKVYRQRETHLRYWYALVRGG